MSYLKDQSAERTVYLTLSDSPVTNVVYTAVTVEYKKAGQTNFQTKILQATDWVNLGGGLYTLVFSAAEMNTLGTFVYKVTGPGFDNLVFDQITVIPTDASGEAPSFVQDSPGERTVYLELAGVPASAIAATAVTAQYKKAGQAAWSPKTLNNDNWLNLGGGYYTIKFTGAELSRVGTFVYTLTGIGFDNLAYDEFTILPFADSTVKDKCRVFGRVRTIGASSPSDMTRVMASMVEFPARFKDSVLIGEKIWKFLDSDGYFELDLLRGATVVIEIPRAGIRHQVVIPDQESADLISLLPPFAVDYTI